MTGDLPLFGQAIRHTFTTSGRARRTEVILYVVASQLLCAALAGLADFFLPDTTAATWFRFAVTTLAIIPLFALSVRRLHDFGFSGKWTVLLVLVVARSIGLELASLLGGWEARDMIEAPLSYVDWLLFLPFAWLYIVLLVVPGETDANRYGPNPRKDRENETAGPDSPEPAA